MALREKLAERATPFLEPEEQVRQAFLAQTGPSPYFVFLSWIIIVLFADYRVVVVTDRAILVLSSGKFFPAKPKKLVARLSRGTPLGPVSGAMWARLQLGTDRMWVHRRFHKDVRAADADVGFEKPPVPPPAT